MTTKVPLSWPILFSTRASNSCWTRDVEMQIRHAKRVKRHQCAWQNGHNSLKYTRSGLLAFLASIMGRPFAGPPQGAQQDLGQSLFFSISNLIAWMHGVFEYLSSDCGPWELLDRALLPSHFARSRSHDWPHSTLPSYINGPAFGEPSLWICFNLLCKEALHGLKGTVNSTNREAATWWFPANMDGELVLVGTAKARPFRNVWMLEAWRNQEDINIRNILKQRTIQ